MAYRTPSQLEIGKTITFMLTENCNLDCKYCYEKNKTLKKMSFETFRNTIEYILAQPVTYNNVIFEFIGGEPLLEFNLLRDIFNYLEYRMKELKHPWASSRLYSVTTNGTVFTEDIKSFLELNRFMFSVSVSIDGIKEVHDINRNNSYDSIMKDYVWWRNTFPWCLTKSTVNREGLPHIFESVKHLIEDLDLTDIYINNVFENIWEENDPIIFKEQLMKIADYLLETGRYKTNFVSYFSHAYENPDEQSLKQNVCGCGVSMMSVDTEGTFYPCLRFQEEGVAKKITVGNATVGLQKDKLLPFAFCNIANLKDEYKEKCTNCKARKICTWCTAANYNVSGSIYKRGKMNCDMILAQYEANEYFFNKIKEMEGV